MLTEYGFRWGPMEVIRRMIGTRGKRTNYVLGIKTQHHDLEIAVSGAGRSVRVWLDHQELVSSPPGTPTSHPVEATP